MFENPQDAPQEINTKNIISAPVDQTTFRHRAKKYFRITTIRISFMASCVALNVVLGIFSHFVLGLIPIYGFLAIRVTFFTYLIILFTINEFYAAITIMLCFVIRIPMGGMLGDDWVGVMAMNLSDLIELFFIALFYRIFTVFFFTSKNLKSIYISMILALILATIINSAIQVAVNYYISLPLYKKMFGIIIGPSIMKEFLAVTFGYNVLQYSINAIIFIALLRVLIVIDKKY